MRSVLFVLALFGCTGSAFSAEPLEGTWELDRAQTTFTAGAPLQGQTLTIQRQGNEFLYTVTGPSAAGSPVLIKYRVPIAGGEGRFITGPYDRVFHKRIDANTREATYLRSGKEVMSFRGIAAKDGKHLRITVKGTDLQGNRVAGLSVYTKR